MSLDKARDYYDEFSAAYEARRRPNDPNGYHALVDDLEIEVVERYGQGRDVLECGCGTGLLLERIRSFARRAQGIDLSPGMLDKARARGLDVREASVTDIPFPDASFDVACSFKVLAHVEDIRAALAEMTRVTRPGGVVLAEFYNPLSLRGLVKRLGPAGRVSHKTRESAMYTRFDAPWKIEALFPPGVHIEARWGVRIVTPAALAMRVPGLRAILPRVERRLAPTPAAYFAGFHVVVARKRA
ncbi:MAG TPA: class I SAM-dependent methyltransferase [Polyangiaceae bacterium]|jgi:ubiquinone/menaquinone biosynthesis C-methylase UbiE